MLRAINLGIRFRLELASLAAFAYWGWTLPTARPVRVAAAIGLPLLVAVLWGSFIAPRARVNTGRVGQAGLGLIVFLAAAAALYDRGYSSGAATFAAIAIGSSVILYFLPQ